MPVRTYTDPACQRLYNWEDEVFAQKPALAQTEAMQLLDMIWQDYMGNWNLPAPKYTYTHNNKRFARYIINDHTIIIPDWACNAATVCHEAAHAAMYLAYKKSDIKVTAHGPEFSTLLLHMWARYVRKYRIHKTEVNNLAKWYNIEFAKPDKLLIKLPENGQWKKWDSEYIL